MVWPAQFLGPLQGDQPTLPAPSRRTLRVPPQPWTLALAPVLRSSHAVHLLDSGRLLAADDPSTSPYAANALLPMSVGNTLFQKLDVSKDMGEQPGMMWTQTSLESGLQS